MGALEGVVMELDDCAFDLVRGIQATDDPNTAFEDADFALLVGSRPRGPGMKERSLRGKRCDIFCSRQGTKREFEPRGQGFSCRNPANTNCLIAQRNATSIPPEHHRDDST